ncbi:unnamed protein product [Microthlaspi erraticum]|uniref:Uncharacterized protein n=1 Tax=Microthlaspi erraticum TaxID=1685480 RepID=A0A6D2I3H6_9BRAS|nr:unnamed protein product [Microthlaspi erraticum]
MGLFPTNPILLELRCRASLLRTRVDYLHHSNLLDSEECQFGVLWGVVFCIVVPYSRTSIGVNAAELRGVRRFLHFAFMERVLRPFGFFVISDLTDTRVSKFLWPPRIPMPCVFSLIQFTADSVMFPFLVSSQLECQRRSVSGRFYDMRRPFVTAVLVWEEAVFNSHVLVGVNFTAMGLSHDERNTMCASVIDLNTLMLLMEWYVAALRVQLLCICNQDSRTNLFIPGGT